MFFALKSNLTVQKTFSSLQQKFDRLKLPKTKFQMNKFDLQIESSSKQVPENLLSNFNRPFLNFRTSVMKVVVDNLPAWTNI